MASNARNKVCAKCLKVSGQVTCTGCNQTFCLTHLFEHRQELSQQMDNLTLENDRLQHSLIAEANGDEQHPLITRIDTRETKSIEKIKKAADEARYRVKRALKRSNNDIGHSLLRITDEVQENRRMEAYTEVDLTKWLQQLKELREKFDKPPMIEIKHDEDETSLTRLSLIQTVILKMSTGNIVITIFIDFISLPFC